MSPNDMEATEPDLATGEYDVQRKHAAEQRLARLTEARAVEEKRLVELARQMQFEAEDVERLEGMSLSAFIAALRGVKDERLKAEREEYVAAKLRHDECAAAIEDLGVQTADVRRQIEELRGAEERYAAALAAREQQVLASGAAERHRVAAIAQETGAERARIHELDEAAAAANAAVQALKAVHESLRSAASWGTWDTWGGGGLISTSIKHSHIDKARHAAGIARQRLQRLNIELADVGMDGAGLEVQLGEFQSFADYFLDGLWADLGVQHKIEATQARVLRTAEQVVALRTRLRDEQGHAARRIEQLEDERRTLLRAARVEPSQE